jgi:hypothetical protein
MEGMAMTAELAVKPPSYEEWLEWQWNDNSWWEWILESEFEHGKTLGIFAKGKDMTFDLYYRRCAGKGELHDDNLFVTTFYDRLSKVSPVMTEMLREGMIGFKWETTNNGHLKTNTYDDYTWWGEEDEFTQGLFKGMQVQPLYDAEPSGTDEKFEDELLSIIDDYYTDILKVLLVEDETRTSTEEYEDWIKNCWVP